MKAILLATAFALVMSLPILVMRLYDRGEATQATAPPQSHRWTLANMPNEEVIMPNPNDPRLHARPLH